MTETITKIIRTPLNPEETRYVVKRLTLGDSYPDVQAAFATKFGGRVLNLTTIGRLKKKHVNAITDGRASIANEGAVSATMLKQKSYQLIEGKLDAALEDASEIRKLRKQLQSGELTETQFKSKMALYENLTINELSKVSEAMHNQAKGTTDNPNTPEDAAAITALLASIQSGNPINIIQMLNPTFNPAAKS